MKMPRYDDVPVFGQDFLMPRRKAASYLGMFRCMGFALLLTLTFVLSSACLLTGYYLLYPLNPPKPTNILVLGVDTRADSNEGVDIGRTDSIMIINIDPQRKQISLLSIPRDLFITVSGRGRLRINAIVREAELARVGTGLGVLEEAIEDNFDIQIDHVVRADFQGFVEVVDAIGGIEIVVPNRIVDDRYPLPDDSGTTTVIFDPGLQWMDGERALQYTRTRQADSDYARAARQQQVIEAIFLKMNTARGLLRLPMVLAAVERNTETDLGTDDALRYVPAILHYAPDGIQTLVITPDYMINEGGINLPNLVALDEWLDDHMRPAPAEENGS